MFDMAGKSAALYYFFVRILLLLSLAGILVACGGNSTANTSPTPTTRSSIPKITITARDFAFAMPDQLQTGFVDITLANQGVEEHQAQSHAFTSNQAWKSNSSSVSDTCRPPGKAGVEHRHPIK